MTLPTSYSQHHHEDARIQTLIREQYRRSVALNNMGVSLMERGAYRESLEVLKDGIVSMQLLSKLICPMTTEDDDERMVEEDSHDDTIQQQLRCPQHIQMLHDHHAAEFAATQADLLKAIRLTASIKSRNLLSHHQQQIQVLSDDAGFHAIQQIQQQQNPTRYPTCHPIRMEDMSEENRNFDLDAGIILCNFAAAHLCQSRLMSTHTNGSGGKDAERLREGAYAIGCVAFQRLSSLIHCHDGGNTTAAATSTCGHHHFQDQVRCDTAIFLATMATLKTLVLVSRESGRSQEAKESFQRLLYLAAALEDATAFDECIIAGAAAA